MNTAVSDVIAPAVWTLRDGTVLTLRHICAEDIELMVSFVRGLSFGARYFRFGHGDIEFTEEEVRRACTPDPDECVHLLVVQNIDSRDTVVASARIVFDAGGADCEIAIAVADAWQKRGIGVRLVRALSEYARRRGLKTMVGKILASNRGMLEFMRKCGFTVNEGGAGSALRIATIAL